MAKLVKAKINNFRYRSGKIMKEREPSEYELAPFDINEVPASGIVSADKNNKLAYSKWVTPKRTRSYPFARVYDTYSFGGKRITVIPIIKDEGLGRSKNKSNNDRINFVTLSWMNLTNVYVILAWYADTDKKSDYRVTRQRFDAEYVKQKIREISEYQLDAHHWNNQHFVEDFASVYRRAVEAYQALGERHAVQMHPAKQHMNFLSKLVDPPNDTHNLAKFSAVT